MFRSLYQKKSQTNADVFFNYYNTTFSTHFCCRQIHVFIKNTRCIMKTRLYYDIVLSILCILWWCYMVYVLYIKSVISFIFMIFFFILFYNSNYKSNETEIATSVKIKKKIINQNHRYIAHYYVSSSFLVVTLNSWGWQNKLNILKVMDA